MTLSVSPVYMRWFYDKTVYFMSKQWIQDKTVILDKTVAHIKWMPETPRV